MRAFLTHLTISSLFLAFLNGLKHGCHICQPFPAPMLLVGLMLVKQLTSGCTKGLAILIITTTLACIVGLVGAPVSLAQLAKLLSAHFLRDSKRRASTR